MANYLPALGSTMLLGATLLAAPSARAQMSSELTMEIYNSNIQVITSGIINKSMLDNAVARNNGRAARGTATGRNSAARRPAPAPPTCLRRPCASKRCKPTQTG